MWQPRRNNDEYKKKENISYFDGRKPVYNLGCGDSYYIPSFLDREVSDSAFLSLINEDEIKWYQTYLLTKNGQMVPQKRLSNTQIPATSNKDANIIPLYRYPANNLISMPIITYTKSVKCIVQCVEKQISQPINHAVVAVYRNGNDHIGYHVDKMLDIKNGSQFAAVSLGTKREFAFQEIDGNKEVHIIAHHGSIVVIGPETNKKFKHSVLRNGNINTPRISISVRYIATFWNTLDNNVSGQGSKYQSLNYPLYPFEKHDLNHNIELVDYKYNKAASKTFVIAQQCCSYRDSMDAGESILITHKIKEICYTQKDSHFRCILFGNIYNKSKGYELLNYLKKIKYPKCIHIPYSMIINGKIFEYNNDGEPNKAKIGQCLFNILKKNNKNENAMIVVVRHWLGTFLGLKNLYDCYQFVSQLLLEKLKNSHNKCFKTSTICLLINLKSKISMNGKLVRIVGAYNEYHQRYPVFVYDTKEIVLIKPENLEIKK